MQCNVYANKTTKSEHVCIKKKSLKKSVHLCVSRAGQGRSSKISYAKAQTYAFVNI